MNISRAVGGKIEAMPDYRFTLEPSPKWLRKMYQAGSSSKSNGYHRTFAYNTFEEACSTIIKKRPRIQLSPPEIVENEINQMVGAFVDDTIDEPF